MKRNEIYHKYLDIKNKDLKVNTISQFYYLFLKSIYKSFSKIEGMDSFDIIIIEGIYFCALETK